MLRADLTNAENQIILGGQNLTAVKRTFGIGRKPVVQCGFQRQLRPGSLFVITIAGGIVSADINDLTFAVEYDGGRRGPHAECAGNTAARVCYGSKGRVAACLSCLQRFDALFLRGAALDHGKQSNAAWTECFRKATDMRFHITRAGA